MNDILSVNTFLKDILDPKNVHDIAINGIQIENEGQIKKIAFVVDASIQSIEKAYQTDANLIIAHHGIFWGGSTPITGSHYQRIRLLLNYNIGLIAYHLPLDSHELYGNNIQILKRINVKNTVPFGYYRGFPVGFEGISEIAFSIDDVLNMLNLNKKNILYLDNGTKKIKKIAVLSGDGESYFDEAIEKNIDLFITGERNHILYHKSIESKINILFAGHYFTETFGVKALMEHISEKLGIDGEFIDIPTGL